MVGCGMPTDLFIPACGGLSFEDGQDRGRIIVSGEDTAGRNSLMAWTVAPCPADQAVCYGAHRHRELEETFYVVSGELDFLLDETVIPMKRGDFVRVPPGARHGYANRSGRPVALLVGFTPGGFEQLFVKYRTDQIEPPDPSGFMREATELHASEFDAV